MANTITDAIPLIVAKSAQVLRKKAFFPRLVNRSYSPDPMQKGQVVNVPIPGAKSVSDVTPAAVAPTASDTTLTNVPITLNKWKKATFYLTAKEAVEMANSRDYINSEMEESIAALANYVSSDLLALYPKVYGYTGTAGTTPFGSSAADAINARKVLNNQLAPADYRYGVLSSEAEANALNLATFQYAQYAGNTTVQEEGELGRRLGFDWYSTTLVPTHTAGTLSNGSAHTALVNGALSAGATTMNVDSTTLTGTIVTGDVFTIQDLPGYSFTVTNASTLTASGNAIAGVTFSPALPSAVADNKTVTFMDTHVVNLAFNRNAFAIAMRPTLSTGELDMPAGTVTQAYTDPMSGIPFRLDVIPGYRQTMFELSLLYGVACIRPECATRIAG